MHFIYSLLLGLGPTSVCLFVRNFDDKCLEN